MAGHTYLYNLLTAIRLGAEPRVEICIVQKPGEPAPWPEIRKLADQAVTLPRVSRWTADWARAGFRRRALRRREWDHTIDDTLRSARVDVVFGSWWHYPSFSVLPSVGLLAWVHDFQFVHLPDLYDQGTLETTRYGITRVAEAAGRVVVSSRDALKDLGIFLPGVTHKARVLPFVANMAEEVYAEDPARVARRYHLPERFVYLPNQFWQHKNHRVALEALRILSSRGVRPVLVCSGLPHDGRKQTHFAEVLTQVAEWGLHEQVVCLGLVPIDHVRALMRQSVCVMNPSLFEGWSSTVEEAKSLGKRLLLSDLAVHREQDPPGAVFFDPKDAEDLALKLRTLWQECAPGPDEILEKAARDALPTRMRHFGEGFLSLAAEVRS
jgi:glycosyltransferase involved in cell wall biosynthesis